MAPQHPDPETRAQSGETASAADGRRFDISAAAVGTVAKALAEEDRSGLRAALATLHAADIADLLEQLSGDDRAALVRLIGADLPGGVLPELEESVRDDVLDVLEPEQLADAVAELESDDVVYVVEDLDPTAQAAALSKLDEGERVAIAETLRYPEQSAGRLMQREVIWSPGSRTVGALIDQMRADDDLPDRFYEIVVVDAGHRPVGVVALGRLMGARRPVTLAEIMEPTRAVFSVDQSQSEVGYAFNQYHLVSAPVVDAAGRLVGVIAIDDAMQVLDAEAEEDLLRLGGVGDEGLSDAVSSVVRLRFPWLAVNLATALLASMVIGLFDAAIEKIVALAILMPIVASMGGNAGTQTLTVAVRAIATKDLTATNAMRIVARETWVGACNGVLFAAIVGAAGLFWFGDVWLALALALAMTLTMLIAGVAGILIPLALQRTGWDPALASGAFVTTVTDVVGFLAFLGLATAILL